MTISDGRTSTVHVGDVVNLRHDHQYRDLKTIAHSGPIVLRRTDRFTYRSFLRTPAHVLVSAPQMVTQSTQTAPSPPATDDPLAEDNGQCCGPAAVKAYRQGRPYCTGDVPWSTLPEPTQSDQQ